jgi:hypothetical protein
MVEPHLTERTHHHRPLPASPEDPAVGALR